MISPATSAAPPMISVHLHLLDNSPWHDTEIIFLCHPKLHVGAFELLQCGAQGLQVFNFHDHNNHYSPSIKNILRPFLKRLSAIQWDFAVGSVNNM